ncbi:hypothetical protein [Desulfogranum marinum]|uniref:hypothetical protein n=1 Tax=Desulfogranum marinum TaxID=453220 RepID=UPI00196401EA|nr:hypothetical protein [Desulfogranum marinum]MBM9512928.1 hypothetical protein [Desulfogranum marinum]
MATCLVPGQESAEVIVVRRQRTKDRNEKQRKGDRFIFPLATHSGMTNQWLKDQGLLSIKDLWVNIHYPATAR